MNKFWIFGAVSLAFALAAGTSAAGEATWTIRESQGVVRVHQPAGEIHKASLKEGLEAGASLTTGGDGRVVLSNGQQEIVVGPNSFRTWARSCSRWTSGRPNISKSTHR
jgi:collagen type III alpha